MKKSIFYSICFVSLFLVNCDNGGSSWVSTNITFLNESSYDLHITIKAIPPNLGFSKEINIKKGESVETWLESVRKKNESDKPRNPNTEKVKINIFNSDTKGLIKEMLNENKLFELIKSDSEVDYYLFKINDDLLSE
jgi:hypothetical protein